MSASALEVAMQTMASEWSVYLKDGENVRMMTERDLDMLVKEQFQNFMKKEIRPGVYEIRIPLEEINPINVRSEALEDVRIFITVDKFLEYIRLEL